MVAFSPVNAVMKENQVDGNAINLDTGGANICVCLATASYTFASSHEFWSSVNANEITGNQYSPFVPGTSGEDLVSSVITIDSPAAGSVAWDAANHTFTQDAGGFSDARHLWFAERDSGTDATARLIMHADLGADFGNVSGDLQFQWDPDGLINW